MDKSKQLPAWGKAQLEAKVAKLNKRARKIGCPEMEVKIVREWNKKEMVPDISFEIDGSMRWSGRYIKMFEVELVGDPPKINGWEFIAALTHSPAGNIIRQTPLAIRQGLEIDKKYRNTASNCDHCQTNRKRHNTFVVRSIETGEVKQVGSSCLIDFLGHSNPEVYFHHDKMLGEIDDLMKLDWDQPPGDFKDFPINLKIYLWHVSQFILDEGFLSRSKAWAEGIEQYCCTADRAFENMFPPKIMPHDYKPKEITGEAKELTCKVIEWGKGLSTRDDKDDYLHNLSVCFANEAISHKELGLAASAVPAYRREIEKKVKDEAERKTTKPSEYFGEIKKRDDFILTLQMVRTWENNYGTTWFHKFVDPDGNVAIWYGSLPLELDDPVNGDIRSVRETETVKVKATVKGHEQYQGTKQTVITRVKGIEFVETLTHE